MIWYHYHTLLLPRGDDEIGYNFPKKIIMRKHGYYRNSPWKMRKLISEEKVFKKVYIGKKPMNYNWDDYYYPTQSIGELVGYEWERIEMKDEIRLPRRIELKKVKIEKGIANEMDYRISVRMMDGNKEEIWVRYRDTRGNRIEYEVESRKEIEVGRIERIETDLPMEKAKEREIEFVWEC